MTADALADQPWATFDRWGGRLFVALALLTAVVGLLVVGPLAVAVLPLPFIAAQMVILVVGAALLYAVAVALGRRWAWARISGGSSFWKSSARAAWGMCSSPST